MMIGYLSGTIIDISDKDCLILTNHIGYHVQCTGKFLSTISNGQAISLFTYHHIKEDSESLFGFSSKDEKNVFKKLLDVNGIGPRGALSILSTLSISNLAQAINEGNAVAIAESPSIGKRTAEKIIIELKDKISDWQTNPTEKDYLLDVRLALESLGYNSREISKALESLPKDLKDTSTLIRLSLNILK